MNKKKFLSADDKVYFEKIVDAINYTFSTDYKNCYRSWFTPAIFHMIGLGNYKLWFPLAPNVGNKDYRNLLSNDGKLITEEFLTNVTGYPVDDLRITYYCELNQYGKRCYKFVGIFKFDGLNNGIRKWVRIKDQIEMH